MAVPKKCPNTFVYVRRGTGSNKVLYGGLGTPIRNANGSILIGDCTLDTECPEDPIYPYVPSVPEVPEVPPPPAPPNPPPGPGVGPKPPINPVGPYNPPDPDDPDNPSDPDNPPGPGPGPVDPDDPGNVPDEPEDPNPPVVMPERRYVTLTWTWSWPGDNGAINALLTDSAYNCYGHSKSHIIGMAFFGEESGGHFRKSVTGSWSASGNGSVGGSVYITCTGSAFGHSITKGGTGSLTVNVDIDFNNNTWSM